MDINEVVNAIDQISSRSDFNHLKESIFRDYFVPFFAGEDVNSPEERIKEWYLVAGAPHFPVIIVDDVDGSELYRVPPIFNTRKLDSTLTSNGQFDEVMSHFKLLRATFPHKADAYIRRELTGATNNVSKNSETVALEEQKAWYEIFKRYGFLKPQSETGNSNQSTKTLEGVDFEPL